MFSSISKKNDDELDEDLGPIIRPPVPRVEEDDYSDLRFSSTESSGWSSSSGDEVLHERKKKKKKRKRKKKRKIRKRRRYYKGKGGVSPDLQVFPTVVGYPKRPDLMVGMDAKDCFVGDEAEAKRGILNLKYPVDGGIVRNMNQMEKIYHHAFYNELRVTPEEHPIAITEASMTRKNDREKLTEMMFETFNVPAFYIASQGVLSLYASGRETGVCLESGHGFTSSVPVFEGYPLTHAVLRNRVSGGEITNYLIELLSNAPRKFEAKNYAEFVMVRDIKEKRCYMALDYETEMERASANGSRACKLELPDGNQLEVSSELFQAPEILFNPSMIGSNEKGMHELIQESIKLIDDEKMKCDMYKNIVLSGGSTMFEGISDRLKDEMVQLTAAEEKFSKNVKVNAPAERKFSVWIGCSILSSLSTFQNMWIIKDEYDDAGRTVVHRKCFGWSQLFELPEFQKDVHGDLRERVELVVEKYFMSLEYARYSVELTLKSGSITTLFVPKVLV